MLKIGLLGSDNSHAERFSEILNLADHAAYWPQADARVAAIWGEEPERTRQVATYGKIERIVDRPEEMLGQVDAVFCITRHGGLHLGLVRPFIEAGVPAFVDKPLAVAPDDARALVGLVERRKVPFSSFSTVRFSADTQKFLDVAGKLGGIRVGIYAGPASRRNPYGGVIFYAIHVIEIMLMAQGEGVEWVQAVEANPADAEGNGSITATCAWPDGTVGTLQMTVGAHYGFRVMAIGTDGVFHTSLDISDCYQVGARRILAVLRGGSSPVPLSQMVEAVQIGYAIDHSLNENRRVYLREV